MKKLFKTVAFWGFYIIDCVLECFFSSQEAKCEHTVVHEAIVKEASCTESGLTNIVCSSCSLILSNKTTRPTGHVFGDFEVVTPPSVNKNGLESRKCLKCNKQEQHEIICKHTKTYVATVKEATCTEEGIINNVCSVCKTVVASGKTSKLECKYGNWAYGKKATPLENGERFKTCLYCQKKKSEKYSMSMAGKNSIYIEGIDLNKKISIASLDQFSVDKYDIIYTEDVGANDPFVLGHNTRSLKNMHKVKVGEYIYLSIDGNIKKYKVVLSEYGLSTASSDDIIGQTSGTSIMHNYGEKTLHMYTCHGKSKRGRWMILAVLED